jgi:hypothetical protein
MGSNGTTDYSPEYYQNQSQAASDQTPSTPAPQQNAPQPNVQAVAAVLTSQQRPADQATLQKPPQAEQSAPHPQAPASVQTVGPAAVAGGTAGPLPQRLPDAGATDSKPAPLGAEEVADDVRPVEGPSELASASDTQVPASAPEEGSLLAGFVPLDLSALEHGVDRFFAELEAQSQDWGGLHVAMGWAPWLTAGAAATAAFELARRLQRADVGRARRWAGYPGLTALPAPDEA